MSGAGGVLLCFVHHRIFVSVFYCYVFDEQWRCPWMMIVLATLSIRPASSRVLMRKVKMDAGDLITMHGAARYDWQHGISAVVEDVWRDDSHSSRSERVSMTFRAMLKDE